LASLNYPAWGYGLRYRYGIFKQEIVDGYQVEVPDYWLDFNPWEFPRHDVVVDVRNSKAGTSSEGMRLMYIHRSNFMERLGSIMMRMVRAVLNGREEKL
jgi:glucan phosphorylase